MNRQSGMLVMVALAGVCCLRMAGCGCGMTSVTYTRGALVQPAHLPSRMGATLDKGQHMVAMEANPWLVNGPTTHEDYQDQSAALYIPKIQLGGTWYAGVTDRLELGAQVRYAELGWSRGTISGIQPFDSTDDVMALSIGGGLRLRVTPPELPAALALLVEFNFVGSAQTTGEDGYGDEAAAHADLQVGLHLSWEMVEHLHLLGLATLGAYPANRYSDTYYYNSCDEDAPDDDSWGAMAVFNVGGGLEFRWEPFFINVLYSYPLASRDKVDYGHALAIQTGVVL